MIAALLAANFLPAVILWRLEERLASGCTVTRRLATIVARVLLFLFILLFVIGAAMLSMFYGKAQRVPPPRSSLPEQSSVSGASPSPAPPSEPSDWLPVYSPDGGRIKSKSDDGEIITLEDGSMWRVYPPDRIHTASWTRMTYLLCRQSPRSVTGT